MTGSIAQIRLSHYVNVRRKAHGKKPQSRKTGLRPDTAIRIYSNLNLRHIRMYRTYYIRRHMLHTLVVDQLVLFVVPAVELSDLSANLL